MVSATAMTRMTSARPTLRCVHCKLVQYPTVKGDCRKCHKNPYELVTKVVLPAEGVSTGSAGSTVVSSVEPRAPRGYRHRDDETAPQRFHITQRELAAIECIAAGMNNVKASAHMGISVSVFKQHISQVFLKLGLKDRVTLAVYWHCELYRIGLHELGYL